LLEALFSKIEFQTFYSKCLLKS